MLRWSDGQMPESLLTQQLIQNRYCVPNRCHLTYTEQFMIYNTSTLCLLRKLQSTDGWLIDQFYL